MFGGGIVIGGAVALGWSRPPGLVAWVVTLVLSAYLAVIGGFTSFTSMDLGCSGGRCATAASTRSLGVIAVVAVLTLACWAETAIERRP